MHGTLSVGGGRDSAFLGSGRNLGFRWRKLRNDRSNEVAHLLRIDFRRGNKVSVKLRQMIDGEGRRESGGYRLPTRYEYVRLVTA